MRKMAAVKRKGDVIADEVFCQSVGLLLQSGKFLASANKTCDRRPTSHALDPRTPWLPVHGDNGSSGDGGLFIVFN